MCPWSQGAHSGEFTEKTLLSQPSRLAGGNGAAFLPNSPKAKGPVALAGGGARELGREPADLASGLGPSTLGCVLCVRCRGYESFLSAWQARAWGRHLFRGHINKCRIPTGMYQKKQGVQGAPAI